jgi:ferredoxin
VKNITEIDLNTLDFTEIITNLRIFIDRDICNGCGTCGEVCPFGLPQITESGKYEIYRPELCTECSACKRNCPTGAIVLNERKGCGCLWNARGQAKNAKKGISSVNSCDCEPAVKNNQKTNCCNG